MIGDVMDQHVGEVFFPAVFGAGGGGQKGRRQFERHLVSIQRR